MQVRPWFISDSEYLSSPGLSPDPRKTVFIGGVPRPMRASELADVMNERFGSVCYAAIDLDTDVNYPKGYLVLLMCVWFFLLIPILCSHRCRQGILHLDQQLH